MSAKKIINEFAEEIKKATEHEDVITARNKVREVVRRWQGEADQMMEDKENRVIYAASVVAAFLLGLMIGLPF